MKGRVGYSVLVVAVCAFTVSATATDIETVEVGNVGNAGEWSGGHYGGAGPDRICGAVNYPYSIGKYEVTAGQYATFLNAVAATDTYGLYDTRMWSSGYACKIERNGEPGTYNYSVAADWADRPVNYVTWGDATRFANWLYNGQPSGPQGLSTTEDGSYFLNGAMSAAELLNVVRKPNATWVVPSEDEWYKAAYHRNNGVTADYYDYPTGTDTAPDNDVLDPDSGNNANFWQDGYALGFPYLRTEAGEFENSASPYGTFDQGGNVWEWNEAILNGWARGFRGGSHSGEGAVVYLHAAVRRVYYDSTYESDFIGFRVALVGVGFRVGDLNCDGTVNLFDIDPFVVAVTSAGNTIPFDEYDALHPDCDPWLADIDANGTVNFFDIDPFVDLLTS